MKKRQKATWFVSGVLCSAVMASTVIPSVAALVEKTITVHTGVQVYVDDIKIDAGNTNGNPEAFIYNGTTYVAVAAVSKSLGEQVQWDGSTRSVYIGDHGNPATSALAICPPYQTDGMVVHAPNKSPIEMAGNKYINYIHNQERWSSALFNLNGKYETFSFDLGHLDSSTTGTADIRFYVDGALVYEEELTSNMLVKHYDIPLDYALQLQVVIDPESRLCRFGLANMELK